MYEAQGQTDKEKTPIRASALGCRTAMAWHFEMVLTFLKADRVSVAATSKKSNTPSFI